MVKFKKEKLKGFMIAVSCLLSIATSVAVAIGMSNATKTTAKVKPYDYTLATVDSDDRFVDSKKSIAMKERKNADGLTIDIDEENATVSYRVVFYGEDGEYLSTTETLQTDYDATSTPETAETFNVVITPYQVDDEDVKINMFTIGKYAKQLDITYNK